MRRILGIGIGLFLLSSLAWAQQNGQINISAEVLPQSSTGLTGSSYRQKIYEDHPEYPITYSQRGSGGGIGFPETTVIFQGRGCPFCKMSILKDGQGIGQTASSDQFGEFSTSFFGSLASGQYMVSVMQEDSAGRRSGLFTFPISFIGGTINKISDLVIPPTLSLDKTEIRPGDRVMISGQSVLREEVELMVNSTKNAIRMQTDHAGNYSYRLDTKDLAPGDYMMVAKTTGKSDMSAWSGQPFRVSTLPAPPSPKDTSIKKELESPEAASQKKMPKKKEFIKPKKPGRFLLKKAAPCLKADFNCDQKVNLTDFSMLRTWYKVATPVPPAFDLNKDGIVDLMDFSILAYHWTG